MYGVEKYVGTMRMRVLRATLEKCIEDLLAEICGAVAGTSKNFSLMGGASSVTERQTRGTSSAAEVWSEGCKIDIIITDNGSSDKNKSSK
jgi:hypothetical protein